MAQENAANVRDYVEIERLVDQSNKHNKSRTDSFPVRIGDRNGRSTTLEIIQ